MADTAAPIAGGKRNKWLTHVKKTMKAHKGKSFKTILRIAGRDYSKKGGALSPAEYSSGGPTVGGRRTRKATRKGGRKVRRGGNGVCDDWREAGYESKAECLRDRR
jgi:hypothetical protein